MGGSQRNCFICCKRRVEDAENTNATPPQTITHSPLVHPQSLEWIARVDGEESRLCHSCAGPRHKPKQKACFLLVIQVLLNIGCPYGLSVNSLTPKSKLMV